MTPLVNKIAELLYPLSDFYRSAGAAAPEVEPIEGEAMPQPYRRLLVHSRDMTPTLEAYFGRPTHLKKLQWHETDDALFRQVLLMVDAEQGVGVQGSGFRASERASNDGRDPHAEDGDGVQRSGFSASGRAPSHNLNPEPRTLNPPPERPVEFGAIQIHLHRFADAPRQRILEGRVPLGRILHDHTIAHYSRPDGFFRFTSDPVIRDAFALHDDPTLYGRHNVLRNEKHEPLAEVVEILPPL